MRIGVLLFLILTFAFSAHAQVSENHAIFGQWQSLNHLNQKLYRSIILDDFNNIRIFECLPSKDINNQETSIVVCDATPSSNKFLRYNDRKDNFWFSQSRLTELTVTNDTMVEQTGLGIFRHSEWTRVKEDESMFVFIKK